MSKFKSGDKVKVVGVKHSWRICRPPDGAIDMIGKEYNVLRSMEDVVLLLVAPPHQIWDTRDLELVDEKTFIDKVIEGANVEYPNQLFKNGKFIGYAVEFVLQNQHSAVSVIDTNGVSIDTSNMYHSLEAIGSKLQIQDEREKLIKMHSVAVKTTYDGWKISYMTDKELSISKHRFNEYKILESWSE